jgi:hypothetical protein
MIAKVLLCIGNDVARAKPGAAGADEAADVHLMRRPE